MRKKKTGNSIEYKALEWKIRREKRQEELEAIYPLL